MIGTYLNLSHTTVHQILTNELGMRKICSKLVLRGLKVDQKDMRRDSCIDFLESIENYPHFPECVITGDETWVFEYDLEIKRHSMEWHIPSSPRQFFDSQIIVHKEFVPPR